ncbi:MAG: ABC transporter permease [Dehalococcoidales bacterium]|nr:ABC transporter permease [Dehalococcoidales bacterium]
MTTYIVRRLLLALVVLILVTAIVFFAMRLLPGDPIRMLVTMSDQASFTSEEIDALRHEYGLDKPIIVQYGDWLWALLHGDLGVSILQSTPVINEILHRLPITFHLGIVSFILGTVIGVLLGVISAVKRGTWLDTVVTFLANLGITIPVFWLGVLMLSVFSVYLDWLPVRGYTSPFDDFWMNTKQMIMPVICLALFPIAGNARQTRSAMLEVMHQDYIRTAWAKGLTERVIVMRHALKNGLIPVVTLLGAGISNVLGGSVLVETVFAIPGMGRLAITSVVNQDYPYIQAFILIIAATTLLANLAVDLLYGWLDPRIRYG